MVLFGLRRRHRCWEEEMKEKIRAIAFQSSEGEEESVENGGELR